MQLKTIAHDRITGYVYQPRHQTDRELEQLVDFIAINGLLVPIIGLLTDRIGVDANQTAPR